MLSEDQFIEVLRESLTKAFSSTNLRTILFDMGVDYDNFIQTKPALVEGCIKTILESDMSLVDIYKNLDSMNPAFMKYLAQALSQT